MFTQGENPCPPFCYKNHDENYPRWYHPHTTQWCLVSSSLPNNSEKCERSRRLIICDVESFTVHLWRIGICDTSKKTFSCKNFCPCNMTNIDDIHFNIIVAHPNIR